MSQFPPPPPGPYDVGGYGSPVPPQYDVMAAVKYGWSKFTQNAGTFVVLGLLTFVIPFAIQLVGSIAEGGGDAFSGELDGGAGFAISAGGGLLGFAFSVAGNIAAVFLSAATIRAAFDATEGRQAGLGEAFGRWDKVQVLVLAVLVGLMTTVGFVLCVIPGIVIAFFTWFATYFVVAGKDAIASIVESFRFTGDHFGSVIMLFLVNVLVLIAGACAFCVGLLVAVPVTVIASAYTFKVLQGQPVAP